MTIEEEARMLIESLREGLKVGIKHYNPETGVLLLTVKDILNALSEHKYILVDFGNNELNRGYTTLKIEKITEH